MKKTTTIQRVDETAVRNVLENTRGSVTEVILRLAWCAGLIPEEMHALKWNDIDLEEGVLHLPDRSVPLDEETAACLRERHEKPFSKRSEYVILSDLRRVHMNRVYIFRFAREALTRGGLEGVTLMSLRHDFILRQLAQHSKSYVARITGVTVATLDTTFIKQMKEEYSGNRADRPDILLVDTPRLAQVILEERGSPVGLTIWLTWKHSLMMKEIVALTWADVDLEAGIIRLEDREVAMDRTLKGWLAEILEERSEGDDPHVVLTPSSRRPYDGPRLSRAVKNVLIKAGLDQVTLRDLYLRGQYDRKDALLLRRAEEQGYVTREETMELFRVGWRPAWDHLHRLVREEKLIRVGARYYPVGAVVPPEQHYDVVRAYLEEEGGAYRKELADLLHIEEKQCGWILTGFVAEGKLGRIGQRYVLPEKLPERQKGRG